MSTINLNGKIFRTTMNAPNGEVNEETLFYYKQDGEIVSAKYRGGEIIEGHLIAIILADGTLDMRYHHINARGNLMAGKCLSIPEILPDGRLRLNESWQWLTGEQTKGHSQIEEIRHDLTKSSVELSKKNSPTRL